MLCAGIRPAELRDMVAVCSLLSLLQSAQGVALPFSIPELSTRLHDIAVTVLEREGKVGSGGLGLACDYDAVC